MGKKKRSIDKFRELKRVILAVNRLETIIQYRKKQKLLEAEDDKIKVKVNSSKIEQDIKSMFDLAQQNITQAAKSTVIPIIKEEEKNITTTTKVSSDNLEKIKKLAKKELKEIKHKANTVTKKIKDVTKKHDQKSTLKDIRIKYLLNLLEDKQHLKYKVLKCQNKIAESFKPILIQNVRTFNQIQNEFFNILSSFFVVFSDKRPELILFELKNISTRLLKYHSKIYSTFKIKLSIMAGGCDSRVLDLIKKAYRIDQSNDPEIYNLRSVRDVTSGLFLSVNKFFNREIDSVLNNINPGFKGGISNFGKIIKVGFLLLFLFSLSMIINSFYLMLNFIMMLFSKELVYPFKNFIGSIKYFMKLIYSFLNGYILIGSVKKSFVDVFSKSILLGKTIIKVFFRAITLLVLYDFPFIMINAIVSFFFYCLFIIRMFSMII